MSEEETNEIPTDVNGVIAYVKKNFVIILMGFLGVGGTGTGISFSDVIYEAALNKVVNDLDSLHGIRPQHEDLEAMIEDAMRYRSHNDSTIMFHGNFINYTLGFQKDIALNDNKVDTMCDGIPMQYNTVNGTFHAEWDGYVYTATKVGKSTWAIFLFNWQLQEGQSNYFELDPMYYNDILMK